MDDHELGNFDFKKDDVFEILRKIKFTLTETIVASGVAPTQKALELSCRGYLMYFLVSALARNKTKHDKAKSIVLGFAMVLQIFDKLDNLNIKDVFKANEIRELFD